MAHSPTKTHAEPQAKATPTITPGQQPALPEKQAGQTRSGLLQRPANATPPDDPAMLLDAGMGTAGRARAMRSMQAGMGNARVARIIDMATPRLQRTCACGAEAGPDGECAACKARRKAIQRQASSPDTPAALPPSVQTAIQSDSGQTLDHASRTKMESAFGADFSTVRVHTSAQADDAARDINAKAFTTGQDIFFASGQHQPGTHEGDKLLAHELTHTIQQGSGKHAMQSKAMLSQPHDPDEQEAEQIARTLVAGSPTLTSPGQGSSETPALLKHGISRIQRRIQLQPDAGPGDAGPQDAGGLGENRQHKGVTVSTDAVYTYDLLKRMATTDGFDAIQSFVSSFEIEVVLPRRPIAGVSDDHELSRDEAILATLKEQLKKLASERDEFITTFESQAKSATEDFLNENQKHVLAEAVRYGLGNLHLEFSLFGGIKIAGEVADNASTRGLGIAAQGLISRKRTADQALAHYREYTHGVPAFAEAASVRWPSPALTEKRAEVDRTKRDLDVYRVQVESKFPILADLSSDQDFKWGELENLSQGSAGKNASTTKVIVNQIVEKLGNIHKVRQELKPGGDITIWLVPEMVEPMRQRLNAKPGTFYGKIVDEKIKDEKPNWITGVLIGLLQLGLVLLAPATGGLSLIPAAAISVGTAYEHFKEYQLKKAMKGTDFGAAALSAEDPSLFWLAVDIIGAGFDLAAAGGAAFRLFRQLAPAAKAVRATQAGEDALRTLERNAAELGGEGLAKRVSKSARELQHGASKEIGITAEETRKFEQAATQIAEKELRQGFQTAETLAGGKVTVSNAGWVFSCSSPCTMMRERFKDLLVREPKYAKRLNDIESRARSLPTGPEGDVARKQIANEAAALEREMRTTALPGDWTSPLKDSPDFQALVKERGSVAAELDYHPPGWSGKKEAKFRYGDGAEAESGYRWTMDENGTLRYDRLDASKLPRRYNPATAMFEDAAEDALIRATKGTEEARELAKLPQKEREAMEAAFKQRGNLIAERDRLEALQEAGKIDAKDAEKLKKLYAQINEQSRQLGEQAAEGVMSTKGGKKIYPLGKAYSTSGDFDQVWKVGDEFHIVEAKGGSSGLGSRAISEGLRAEQGTIEYATSIAENMAKNGASKEIRQLGRELQAAIQSGKVKYILVRAPVGTEAGTTVLRDVKVSEFMLKK